ncbi:IlvB Thiamine pyrophosphate-requiring enzyme [Pyrenophora tritici-repentis]|uniref:Acetolactate synthase n=2 Tax=Pyrenophora tritici-repentis TaxID=45151 RepID=A0A2W1GZY7_9PLEO|nr:acetolactate synthase, mitochondrial precursor [Pyrenophora tritici-repentis Pt-1C-BFP]KAA8615406.1 Acetolactate synthase [Pyrenophora tritici-repentis]EDU51563.1 acetolactate synthase, mitochondrial precursor [Pyrenophora tritici-repentis Pt-1C-BFP]KAF7444020.1 Acetolactate synthase [Pyrenophora tritici-repentis]KAF7566245.1 IlvB, Thiamine pyrophosphate-requiring enzyme [Pyrenophora tritici-repentis]KAG9379758.1 Acetolactate synthase [Pyrenophora tritici-repentis]
MQQSRTRAVNALKGTRNFSTTAQRCGISPFRRPAKVVPSKVTKDEAKRPQSTAAAATQTQSRSRPSPAFNREDYSEVQPLKQYRSPAMDHSFVGMTGGEIFHEMMLRQGVKHIFGYPGGAILPVFDAIYQSKHFDFILPRHEQGAGHMAEGYARASGKPGVVLVTSGPGATNVVTPMQDALMDGTPLIVFCGQVVTSAIGSDAFQEADMIGITRPCTKWNVLVKNVAELPRRINEAFEIATSGRPGPVLVDLPKDVTASVLQRAIPMSSSLPTTVSAATIAARELSKQQLDNSIRRSANLINMAKKPVIYAGQGIMQTENGPQLLKELADKVNIPVTTTLQGLGGFDELDPKSLHMLGMHGSAYANMAMQEADLILALGARFDDRITGAISKFAPAAKAAAAEGRGGIIHFEIMPKNINKVIQATEAVEGDLGVNLKHLLPLVNKVEDRPEWLGQIAAWKERFPWAYEKEGENGLIKPQTVMETLSNLTADRKEETILTTGVGQHQMWCAQHYRWRYPRTMITSGGLGTMGYGLPAAIGAKVARPDCMVIDIDGDSSFSMTLTELSTAAEFNIGVKVIILNNEEQGMVTQWQTLFYTDRFAHTHQRNADFVKLGDAMGVQAKRCTKPDELEASLKWLLATDGPALLEIVTDQKVPVLPMVPAGSALHEFMVYDEKATKERRAQTKSRSGR